MISRSYKKPTKAEASRMARLKEMPCIACMLRKRTQPYVTEVHHIVSGNKRVSHSDTVPLCVYHHRGLSAPSMGAVETRQTYGPSLALMSKKFHEEFGTDEELLATTNTLLGIHNALLEEGHIQC